MNGKKEDKINQLPQCAFTPGCNIIMDIIRYTKNLNNSSLANKRMIQVPGLILIYLFNLKFAKQYLILYFWINRDLFF